MLDMDTAYLALSGKSFFPLFFKLGLLYLPESLRYN